MQMSYKLLRIPKPGNNSNELLRKRQQLCGRCSVCRCMCAGACDLRSNFASAQQLHSSFASSLRQPCDFAPTYGSIEVNGVSPRLCDIIRLYILSGSHPCGRRRRFISQIRFVARNNDSSTSNLGFGTMNARTFFFFFSTTGNLRRHNAIFLSGDNKLYIIISAASALSFCLAAIDASLDPPSTCSDRDIDTALIDVEMTD